MDPEVTPKDMIDDIFYDLSLIRNGTVKKNLEKAIQQSLHYLETVCLPELQKNSHLYSPSQIDYVKNKYRELRNYS